MSTATLKDILKEYLKHIVYLDDTFNAFWKREKDKEEELYLTGRPPVPGQDKNIEIKNREIEVSSAETSEKQLYNFCKMAQEDFGSLIITPIVYDKSAHDKDKHQKDVINKLKKAKFLVIDGNLDEGARYSAVDVVEKLKNQNELKLIVVYTAKYEEMISNFSEKGYEFEYNRHKGKPFNYTLTNEFVLMICEKNQFNFNDIVDAYSELFLSNYGYFPVAFLEMINRIESKNSEYLLNFSKPFDSLIFLQTQIEGLPLENLNNSLNTMVFNNIRQDIRLSDNILDNIYEEELKGVRNAVDMPEFCAYLKESIKYIGEKSGCKKEVYEVFINDIEKNENKYKEFIKTAVSNKNKVKNKVKVVSSRIKDHYAELTVTNNESYSKLESEVQEYLKTAKRIELDNLEFILPIFLTVFARKSKGISKELSILNMLSTLKIHRYSEKESSFSSLFSECYEKEDEGFKLKDGKTKYFTNKLFTGDVYFETIGKMKKTLLCITPSCHVFRPKKVSNIVQLVEGEILEVFPENLKDSEHLSLLPDPSGEKEILQVKWCFNKIVSIDLNKLDGNQYHQLIRPYRITDEYHKQIMSKFNAFYSKVGVEELFVKSHKSIADILIGNTSEY